MSEEFLRDSETLLQQGGYRSSVDRAYYSIHYCVLAMLDAQGVRPPRSHRGLVNLFGARIVNPGLVEKEFADILSEALRYRSLGTYDRDAVITREDAEETVSNARRFLSRAQEILQD